MIINIFIFCNKYHLSEFFVNIDQITYFEKDFIPKKVK